MLDNLPKRKYNVQIIKSLEKRQTFLLIFFTSQASVSRSKPASQQRTSGERPVNRQKDLSLRMLKKHLITTVKHSSGGIMIRACSKWHECWIFCCIQHEFGSELCCCTFKIKIAKLKIPLRIIATQQFVANLLVTLCFYDWFILLHRRRKMLPNYFRRILCTWTHR